MQRMLLLPRQLRRGVNSVADGHHEELLRCRPASLSLLQLKVSVSLKGHWPQVRDDRCRYPCNGEMPQAMKSVKALLREWCSGANRAAMHEHSGRFAFRCLLCAGLCVPLFWRCLAAVRLHCRGAPALSCWSAGLT